MKFEWKVRLMFHKNYMDCGINMTKYFMYLLVLFGWVTNNKEATIYASIAYIIFSYILGWAYFRFGWMKAQMEVSNRVNPFVEEVRKDLNNSVATINHGK